MKRKFLLIVLILAFTSFFANAQQSTYIKNRLTFDGSYTQMQNSRFTKNCRGISFSANYGVAKFLESGLYYNYVNPPYFHSEHFAGIQNRFHILPFLVKTDNKFFRFDAYVFNQTGLQIRADKGLHIHNIEDGSSYEKTDNSKLCHTDVGLGTAVYLFGNVAIRFEYKWVFSFGKILGMQVKPYYQRGFDVGLSLKF